LANTKQQRKRIKITERERTENLKYKSRIKTMFKTLTIAAQEDKERAAQQGIELISLIDKAASRGVIHANNAARKKSRVNSIVALSEGSGKPKGPPTREAKNQSKADKRAGRSSAKAEKKAAVALKQKAKAEAEAKAAKAKPKKAEETPAEAAVEAPGAEAPGAEAPEAEAPTKEAPTEEATAESEPEETPAAEAESDEPADAEEKPKKPAARKKEKDAEE